MKKEELIAKMVEEKAQTNNTIDLDAYARGLEDMFDNSIPELLEMIQSFKDIIVERVPIQSDVSLMPYLEKTWDGIALLKKYDYE